MSFGPEARPFVAAAREKDRRRAANASTAWDPRTVAIAPQRAVLETTARRVTLCCGRRSGKSTGYALLLLDGARRAPNAAQFYVAPTLKQARLVFWPILKRIARDSGLPTTAHEVDLCLRVAGAPIYLAGAKDTGEIDKLRGHNPKRVVIDEGKSIRPTLFRELVEDVIEPGLMDYRGQLMIGGTPGPVPAGYFYEACKSVGWEHHAWNAHSNPTLAAKSGRTVEQLLAEIRERNGWTEDSPSYRREYLGEWTRDEGALALHYDPTRNGCGWQREPQEGWRYVLGGDLGYEDADALTVQGWAPHSRKVQKVAELVKRKQGISELGREVRAFYDLWHPIACPFDFGGLGKKIAEELITRWQVPVKAAEKTRKAEHIALLDDALLAGNFLAPPDSRFAEDCGLVTWDSEAKRVGELRLSEEYHSDICDADLYAFRECHAHLEQPAPPQDLTREPEAAAMREARLARLQQEQQQAEIDDEGWA